jgi:acylphosphatase
MTGHQSPGVTPQPETAAVEAWITGRVQGVGFRYFAFEAARRLGVAGYVRNTRDGGVRAYAEGPREKLEQFLRILEQGPQGSRVREMRVTWGYRSGSYPAFRIETTL